MKTIFFSFLYDFYVPMYLKTIHIQHIKSFSTFQTMFNKLILFCLLFILNYAYAQIPVGTWRDHLPYNNVKMLADAGNKIFCATPYAVFSYNKSDNSIEKLSKINGLSDIGVSAINYAQNQHTLIIAYSNGNIDLIANNTITNIADVKRKAIQGQKRINNIMVINDLAYLSCGFGIVVLNLAKQEIADTYYIGQNGGLKVVNQMTYDANWFYAATENGVYKADRNSPYLIDFNNWKQINDIPNFDKNFNSIVSMGNSLFASYYDEANKTGEIYILQNKQWRIFSDKIKTINSISTSQNYLMISSKDRVYFYDETLALLREATDVNLAPNHALYDAMGTLWIGDGVRGLVRNFYVTDFQTIMPNGPATNHAFEMSVNQGNLVVAGGGKNSDGNMWQFCELNDFRNQNWSSTILWDSPARDFVSVLVNPANSENIFAGSWGSGLFEFSGDKLVNRYSFNNSSLQSMTLDEIVRVSGITFDNDGNLWVANSEVKKPISVRKPDGTWLSFGFNNAIANARTGKLINTTANHKWLQIPESSNLFAFDDNGTPDNQSDDRSRSFTLFINQPENQQPLNLVSAQIFSMAEDLDGAIWVGTDRGIGVYYSPTDVFTTNNFYAEGVRIKANPNDSLVFYLLKHETVTAIAIDGANRKWFGTEKAGVFLVSKDGSQQILNFNVDNSPLISNTILSLAIDQKSGEVFFGTDQGLVSYRGTATQGDDGFGDVYAFPNPVRPSYDGNITITGLAANINVKITDITGNLVYETNSLGGQAIWNGRTQNGDRVHTGVYLVFCSNDDGSKTFVTKILFIN